MTKFPGHIFSTIVYGIVLAGSLRSSDAYSYSFDYCIYPHDLSIRATKVC